MRYEEAAACLARLSGQGPGRLPPGPVALMPVLADGSSVADRTSAGRESGGGASEAPVGDRPAAVLVLVAPGADSSAIVILTERATYDGVHSGEVSFPGGKVEPGDADLEATALREANEEIDLDPAGAGVELLGRLDEMLIPVSRFSLTPIVAVARRRAVLQASPAEVARIIEAPLSAFLPGAPIEIVERTVRDWPLRYGGYRVDGLHVWGATGRILGQLGALVAQLGRES